MISSYYDRFPIYKLPNDTKMWLIKQAVSEVKIEKNQMVVKVDPFGFAAKMIMMALTAIGLLVASCIFICGIMGSRTAAGIAIISLS